MRVLTLMLVTSLLIVLVGSAQEKDAPAGQPPKLWLASASEQDGEIVIQIAEPVEQAGAGGPGGFGPGVKTLPSTMVMKWMNLPKVTLGKTVRAFRVNGERADPKSVLTSLAKPKGVALFIRNKETDPPNPDAFYLSLFREDTLVLVVNHKDIYSDQP